MAVDRRALLLLAATPGLVRAQTPIPTTGPTDPPATATASAPPAPSPPRPAPAGFDRAKSYYVFFDTLTDVASLRTLRRQAAAMVEAGVSDIHLVISSPGGLIDPTLRTYSFLRALPARISTHAQGMVASSATILFLAGEARSADRNARFLFHPLTAPVQGVFNEQQLEERAAESTAAEGMMSDIYLDRTSFTPQQVAEFAHDQLIYTAEQARSFNVVQTVADLRIPADQSARTLLLD